MSCPGTVKINGIWRDISADLAERNSGSERNLLPRRPQRAKIKGKPQSIGPGRRTKTSASGGDAEP